MSIIPNQNLFSDVASALVASSTAGCTGPFVGSSIMLLQTGAALNDSAAYADLTPFEADYPGYARSALTWSGPYDMQSGGYGLISNELNFVPTTAITAAQGFVGYAVLGAGGSHPVLFVEPFSDGTGLNNSASVLNVVLDVTVSDNGLNGSAEVLN